MLEHPPYVAGAFYPLDKNELNNFIQALLIQVPKFNYTPKAMICPHAGYIYSGLTAAYSYVALENAKDIKRVVLLGPAHRYPFIGVAATQVNYFVTPLGKVAVDHEGSEQAIDAGAHVIEKAYVNEHCLEVQLPFLQTILKDFRIVPLIVGQTTYQIVTQIINALWGGDDTLIVVSSDLSHYHAYDIAKTLDASTNKVIMNLEVDKLQHERACGATPIQGLLQVAHERGMQIKLIDMRNSGDTAGDKQRVVGYASYHLVEHA